MLKQLILGAASIVTGVVPFSGVASAEEGRSLAGDFDSGGEQVGLVNVTNLETRSVPPAAVTRSALRRRIVRPAA